MIEMSVLKDASEIIIYNHPDIPLYVQQNWLSSYVDMAALCHWHEDIEYLKAVKGHMAYHVNGRKIQIKENDAVLVNSRQMHYGFSEDKTDCLFNCIVFDPRLISANAEILRKYILPVTEYTGLPYFYLDSSRPEYYQIIKQFDKIYDEYQKEETGYELTVIDSLMKAWLNWYRLLMPDLVASHDPVDESLGIQRDMISYIHQNYAAKLTLKNIADAGNVCKSKCCQIFKDYLNRSPIEFLNAYRLEASMRLLIETPMNITEIALSCGFHSSSYYSEIFRQYKGCAPSEYRRLKRNTANA